MDNELSTIDIVFENLSNIRSYLRMVENYYESHQVSLEMKEKYEETQKAIYRCEIALDTLGDTLHEFKSEFKKFDNQNTLGARLRDVVLSNQILLNNIVEKLSREGTKFPENIDDWDPQLYLKIRDKVMKEKEETLRMIDETDIPDIKIKFRYLVSWDDVFINGITKEFGM